MDTQDLQQANDFACAIQQFNDLSENFVSAYQTLEQKVTDLTWQLVDIKERRLHEKQQKEQLAEKLAALIDAFPVAVVVLTPERYIDMFNKNTLDIFPDIKKETLFDSLLGLQSVKEVEYKNQIKIKGHTYNIISRRISTKGDAVVLFHDVTEIEAAHTAINSKNNIDYINEISAGIVHEIRTPLSTALINAVNIKNENTGSDVVKGKIERIISSIKKIESVVNVFISSSRSRMKKSNSFHVKKLLDSVSNMLESNGFSERVNITSSFDKYSKKADVNPEIFSAVIRNLIANAFQAGGSSTVVAIKFESDADNLTVNVVDNGPGVDKKNIHQIFEPFFTTRLSGTGMGLYLSKQILNRHGGDLVLNKTNSRGTEFTLSLPLGNGRFPMESNSHVA